MFSHDFDCAYLGGGRRAWREDGEVEWAGQLRQRQHGNVRRVGQRNVCLQRRIQGLQEAFHQKD